MRNEPLRKTRGATLLEMMFVLLIIGIVVAIALPSTKTALTSYHLGAAVKDVSGAIQSTRYLAIMRGATYNIVFNQSTRTYQVNVKVPPATSFSTVGNLVPWSTTTDVSLSPSTTLEFSPGGTMKATTGTLSLVLTNGTTVETITVSEVGNVSVSP